MAIGRVNVGGVNLAKLVPENIKAGVRVGGTLGTFSLGGSITSKDILKGKIGFSNGQEIIGTLEKTKSYKGSGSGTFTLDFVPFIIKLHIWKAPDYPGDSRSGDEVLVRHKDIYFRGIGGNLPSNGKCIQYSGGRTLTIKDPGDIYGDNDYIAEEWVAIGEG